VWFSFLTFHPTGCKLFLTLHDSLAALGSLFKSHLGTKPSHVHLGRKPRSSGPGFGATYIAAGLFRKGIPTAREISGVCGVTKEPNGWSHPPAYRQQALACAASLADGPRRTSELRAVVPNAFSIVLRNVYGWFTRIDRGLL
jgi:hypothetical protein